MLDRLVKETKLAKKLEFGIIEIDNFVDKKDLVNYRLIYDARVDIFYFGKEPQISTDSKKRVELYCEKPNNEDITKMCEHWLTVKKDKEVEGKLPTSFSQVMRVEILSLSKKRALVDKYVSVHHDTKKFKSGSMIVELTYEPNIDSDGGRLLLKSIKDNVMIDSIKVESSDIKDVSEACRYALRLKTNLKKRV